MKPFFTARANGGDKTMAEVLACIGIRDKMRYDPSMDGWRIYDKDMQIWRARCMANEAELIVIEFVAEQLRPIEALESFRGVKFNWAAESSNGGGVSQCVVEDAGESLINTIGPNDSVSVCSSRKRKRGTGDGGRVSQTLELYSERTRNAVCISITVTYPTPITMH